MRRPTKPFTVEVKKRGGRRRDGVETVERTSVSASPMTLDSSVGRDSRFREAESFFRAIPVEADDAEPDASFASQSADAAPRRILPDLIAEAALSDTPVAEAPEPRRRGRPPKTPSADGLAHPVKPRDNEVEPQEVEEISFSEEMDPQLPAPVLPPAVLYLAASARRRAARATDNLPRAERWKRRLPKVCW